ncbi:hypothetical protein IAQ61_007885 [Plenodomus lingam]|uniref:uncharacterized protein n=1 Tax=Leptosphaeria maculans TaxID=5022 RepID=UPI00332E8815|nr:hypothetical protein IAQ61_007885 [Plenodomus lingam]
MCSTCVHRYHLIGVMISERPHKISLTIGLRRKMIDESILAAASYVPVVPVDRGGIDAVGFG